MNLHQLELFCTVVEQGRFSLASRHLHISQPALSVQIRRLERSVGLSLLRHSRTGLIVTPAGAEIYSSARTLLD
jgi:DNA-binding transcriptional LysR family regulator